MILCLGIRGIGGRKWTHWPYDWDQGNDREGDWNYREDYYSFKKFGELHGTRRSREGVVEQEGWDEDGTGIKPWEWWRDTKNVGKLDDNYRLGV